jgi:antagonist of KipI
VSVVVLEGGFLTTVQDLGRPGYAALGVSAAGAADPIALRAGNRIVGNPEGCAALEMTLVGATLRFEYSAWIALTGATGEPLWAARRVAAGETVACGPCRGGARAYLCVGGGLDVPLVLGSASTHLATGLGGVSGRALRGGDRLVFGTRAIADPLTGGVDPRAIPGYADEGPLRVVDGPQGPWFTDEARRRFETEAWDVTEACDRMGIRLEGAPLARTETREPLTEGVPLGAIQIASSGRPIVLFVDHQTTGGYPKIACVIAADLPRLGRVRPRDRLRFRRVELSVARQALSRREEALVAILA